MVACVYDHFCFGPWGGRVSNFICVKVMLGDIRVSAYVSGRYTNDKIRNRTIRIERQIGISAGCGCNIRTQTCYLRMRLGHIHGVNINVVVKEKISIESNPECEAVASTQIKKVSCIMVEVALRGKSVIGT